MQVYPTKVRSGVEDWELSAIFRVKENAQKWATAQKLVARQRKFAFGVVWDAFGQEVKEGRYFHVYHFCVTLQPNALAAWRVMPGRRSFLFIMERIKIKERVKGWRGWREYMGAIRQQNALVGIFMHKKRIQELRCIVMAWKDQIRCGARSFIRISQVIQHNFPELVLRCATKFLEKNAFKCRRLVDVNFGRT